jgi:hypothetical protein
VVDIDAEAQRGNGHYRTRSNSVELSLILRSAKRVSKEAGPTVATCFETAAQSSIRRLRKLVCVRLPTMRSNST